MTQTTKSACPPSLTYLCYPCLIRGIRGRSDSRAHLHFLVCSLMAEHGVHIPAGAGSTPAGPPHFEGENGTTETRRTQRRKEVNGIARNGRSLVCRIHPLPSSAFSASLRFSKSSPFYSSVFQQENARLQPGRRWCKSIRSCHFFNHGPQALQRSSWLLTSGARGSTVAVHQGFGWARKRPLPGPADKDGYQRPDTARTARLLFPPFQLPTFSCPNRP